MTKTKLENKMIQKLCNIGVIQQKNVRDFVKVYFNNKYIGYYDSVTALSFHGQVQSFTATSGPVECPVEYIVNKYMELRDD